MENGDKKSLKGDYRSNAFIQPPMRCIFPRERTYWSAGQGWVERDHENAEFSLRNVALSLGSKTR